MNDETPIDGATCATCGQPLHGPYCSHCGEKKLDKHDRRIINIFEEFFHSLTHADSKFLRSLKYLFTRPGFLTNEYLAGRRKRYSTPLSLFFIANLLYLLLSPVDTFNSHFESMIKGQPYSQALMPQVYAKMEAKGWTMTQLEEHYNEHTSHEAKLLLIVCVFILSLPTALLFISRKRYYYDYVVFAMEYFNFVMYSLMLLIPFVVILIAAALQWLKHGGTIQIDVNAPFILTSLLLLLWVYLSIAARRVFQQAWWLTIAKTAVLVICTIITMYIYRYIVFEATMLFL